MEQKKYSFEREEVEDLFKYKFNSLVSDMHCHIVDRVKTMGVPIYNKPRSSNSLMRFVMEFSSAYDDIINQFIEEEERAEAEERLYAEGFEDGSDERWNRDAMNAEIAMSDER